MGELKTMLQGRCTMVGMTATTGGFPVPGSGPMTVRDLEAMPDDGRRYELIDGVLVVSPAPGTRHQIMVYKLFACLDAVCPPEFAVMGAPYAVHDGDNPAIELQPDVLVGKLDEFTERDLPKPPVLVIEVLSPSTALYDLNTKKAVYQRLGVASYWVIDPKAVTLTVWELSADGYLETVTVSGPQPYDATVPFPVRIVPQELLGRFA